ncbi:MAG: DNA-protecting protein DprA [Planctomycetes bacterium]|nr:DNA-protecting protein DprA [Planctomycetota bacterium]
MEPHETDRSADAATPPAAAPPSAALHAALLIALAQPDERELAALREQQQARPGTSPLGAEGVRPATRERLAQLEFAGAAEAEAARAAAQGLVLIDWNDARYPAPLHDLAGPPALLYVRGRGELPTAHAIAIVGARASTARGRAFAHALGAGVAQRGGTVVSGLAIGIDQAALEGALAEEGRCCAVLACGLDQVYPPGARPLAERLLERGTLVSEMPIGTPPYKNHFPRRNRLLAALARATLVIEADLHSGSLVTARRAAELGRAVHAVPGAIDATVSRGTNRLIRDGAHPLLEVGDLDLLLPGGAPRVPSGDELLRELASPRAAEELATRCRRPLDRVLLQLVELEANGRVERLGGGLYVRRGAAP